MTEEDVRQKLENWMGDKTLKEAGNMIGVSAPFICQVLSGQKPPTGKVLDFLGLKKTICYSAKD